MGIEYAHEILGNRIRIERWPRELKDRTKRLYNNVNTKTIKSLKELVKAIVLLHNILMNVVREGGVIPG